MANIFNKTKLISLENYVFSLPNKTGKNLCIHLVYEIRLTSAKSLNHCWYTVPRYSPPCEYFNWGFFMEYQVRGISNVQEKSVVAATVQW